MKIWVDDTWGFNHKPKQAEERCWLTPSRRVIQGRLTNRHCEVLRVLLISVLLTAIMLQAVALLDLVVSVTASALTSGAAAPPEDAVIGGRSNGVTTETLLLFFI